MEPLKKAEQIKRHFLTQMGKVSEENQVKYARTYIGKLLEGERSTLHIHNEN